jgi:histidine ammonia-lyase
VRLDPARLERTEAAHAVILRLAARDVPLYGVTTGSGANRGVPIPPAERETFQINLVTSHCVGVGSALSVEVVRALLLIRAHGIARGGTGA